MGKLTDLPIIRLMKEWDGDQAASLLEEIATYAHGIGPRQDLWGSKKFRDEAKRLKLQVHPWTLKDDTLRWTDNPISELNWFIKTGADGIFIEFPHLTSVVLDYQAKYPKYGGEIKKSLNII